MMESLKRQGTGVMAKMHPWYAQEVAHHRLPEHYDFSGPILFQGGPAHNRFMTIREWRPCWLVAEPLKSKSLWKNSDEPYDEGTYKKFQYNLTTVVTISSVYFVYICVGYNYDPNKFGAF